MTAAKKFTFDTVFDPEVPLPRAIQAEEEIAEEAEPVAPTFSETEMAQAREESYAQGREEGLKEQADAVERQILDLLNTVNTRLGELFQMEQAAGEDRSRNAVAVAVAIVRKMFPHLQDQQGLRDIENLVVGTLAEIADEPKVTITVHPSAKDSLTARLAKISTETRFEGEIDIQTDEILETGDCRMAWSHGGIERKAADLWQQIDEIIEKNLGTPPSIKQTIETGAAPAADSAPTTETDPAADLDATNASDDAAPNAGDDHG